MTNPTDVKLRQPARLPRWLRRLLLRWACWWGLLACVLAALITFGTRPPPPAMPGLSATAVAAERSQPMAPVGWFRARDGAWLACRFYRGSANANPAMVAVLIHGSGGSSKDMNVLGRALAAAGIPAFAPDVRGQGLSGRRGDIDYIGQQEDDLADLVARIRNRYPRSKLVLVGHSSGGGFALRIAGESVGRLFSKFVLLAPNLGHNAVTTRPGSGGWVSIYTPRIVGLSLLNRIGIKALNGLPVIAFALPPAGPNATTTRFWSYRMMMNFGPHGEADLSPGAYKIDVAKSPGPITVIVGDRDELFRADRYADAFAGVARPVTIRIVPGVGHIGVTNAPIATRVIISCLVQCGRGMPA